MQGLVAVAAIMFSIMAYKAWRVHARVPQLSFTEQGLQTDSAFLFSWSQVEHVAIDEVTESSYVGHGFQPVDGYTFNTGHIDQQYAGRRLVVYGKHKSRLWVNSTIFCVIQKSSTTMGAWTSCTSYPG